MIKVWFLMALLSYPDYPAIVYKGFGGFLNKEKCEEQRIKSENYIVDFETKMGRTIYIETFCLETYTFPTSLKNKLQGTGLGV